MRNAGWKSTTGPVVTQYSRVWIKSLSPNIFWDLPFLCTFVWNKFICYFLETRINKKKGKDTKNPDALEKAERRAQEWQLSTWRQMSVAPRLCPGLTLTCKTALESGCYSTGADHSPFHQQNKLEIRKQTRKEAHNYWAPTIQQRLLNNDLIWIS